MQRHQKHLILLFALLLPTILLGQIRSGVVLNSETGDPLPYANISVKNSSVGTITNERGEFQIRTSGENETYIVISHIGYKTIEIPTNEWFDGPKIFELEFVGYNLPVAMISNRSAESFLFMALKNIERNYPQSKHMITGFYNEKLVHVDERIFTYGEGIIESLKLPYRNMPSNKRYLKEREKVGTSIMDGFFEDFMIPLEDKYKEKHGFPSITEGGTLVEKLDLLKGNVDFVTQRGKKIYNYQYAGMTFDGEDPALIISFKPKGNLGFYQGNIVINERTLAILYSDFEFSENGVAKYSEANPIVDISERKYRVVYGGENGLYTLQQAGIRSVFIFEATGDTLINTINFAATNLEFGEKVELDRTKLIGENDVMSAYVPIDQGYWKDDNIIVRTEAVQKALDERKQDFTPGEPLIFKHGNFTRVKRQAQEERKLIFVDFYADWCVPCKELEKTTFRHPELQSALNQYFIPYKIDIDIQKDNHLIKKVGLKSIPLLVVLSPWGHVVHIYNRSRNPEEMRDVLMKVVDAVNLEHVYSKLDSFKINAEEGSYLAGKAILLSSLGSVDIHTQYFYDDVLGPKKTWKEGEKLELIYDLVGVIPKEDLRFHFLKNLKDFESMYTRKELNKKVYELAFMDIGQGAELNTIEEFLKSNILGDPEYYLLKSEVDFYTYMFPDELSTLDAQLLLYRQFQLEEWAEFRTIFLEMILTALTKEHFDQLKIVANLYKERAEHHEWLDLYSLILYKSGEENEALKMIAEIKDLAWAKGINYKPAIYNLREK